MLDKILSNYEDLRTKFEGKDDTETLRNILNSYDKIEMVLDLYDIKDYEELESRLENYDTVQESVERIIKMLQERLDNIYSEGRS